VNLDCKLLMARSCPPEAVAHLSSFSSDSAVRCWPNSAAGRTPRSECYSIVGQIKMKRRSRHVARIYTRTVNGVSLQSSRVYTHAMLLALIGMDQCPPGMCLPGGLETTARLA
jgi:hypothetical protein